MKLAKSPAEAKTLASQILGMMLKTHQTGPEGQKVGKVYVEEGLPIEREFYLGMTLDRATSRLSIMASSEGGVEIEEVAAKQSGERSSSSPSTRWWASRTTRPGSWPSGSG